MQSIHIAILLCLITQLSYAQSIHCPPPNEEAKKDLMGYLNSEENIKDLREKNGLTLTDSSFKSIKPLTEEMDKEVCSEISENAPFLKNKEHYSFYKVEEYYFVVAYSDSNTSYRRDFFEILDSKYERLITVMDF